MNIQSANLRVTWVVRFGGLAIGSARDTTRWSGEAVKMVALKNIPSLKTNMEPEDGSEEKEIPIRNLHFWVLC